MPGKTIAGGGGGSGDMLAANNLSDVANAGTARTNLGVGTGNSPEFAAVNIGHASDTTLTRTGAGDVAVEGNAVYRAGGTDVPVLDGGTGSSTAAGARTNLGCDDIYAQALDDRHRCYRSRLPTAGSFTMIEDSAYFVYMGYTTKAITPKHVEFYVAVGGTGAQTAEVGIFTSTAPPNKGNQTLTKVEATGTVDDMTSTGVKRNTSAFTTSIPAGSHVWVGIRTAMATNEPAITGIGVDFGQGSVTATSGAGALTAAGPWTGVPPAAAATAVGPYLTMVLD